MSSSNATTPLGRDELAPQAGSRELTGQSSVSTDGRTESVAPDASLAERRSKALANCAAQIAFFEGSARWAHRFYVVSQILTIVLSGLIPVVLLRDVSVPIVGASPEVVAALLSAIVTIMAGLSAAFRWKENWTRYAYFAQALISEKAKFETRTTADYSADRSEVAALDTFVTRTENVRMSEVAEWREHERSVSAGEARQKDDRRGGAAES